MDAALPATNQPVTLRDVTRTEYPSRIEYDENGLVALVRPTHFPATEAFGVGYRVEMLWPDPSGMQVQPIEVVEARTDGQLRLWLARPSGPRRREQRRAYVRVPMGVPLAITHEEEHIKAVLVDVSEAGARARVAQGTAVRAGDTVHAGFNVGGVGFAVEASTLRLERDDDHVDLVLLFDIPEKEASDLRRAVFAEQIRQRQLLPEE